MRGGRGWDWAGRVVPAFLGLGLIAAGCPAAGDGPNVLLIVCDDLNCDLGCYGDPQVRSPNIDALAARGVRFDEAHCQYPLCGPSRASFMTGLYPGQTGITANAIHIRQTMPKVKTLPMAFRDAGYRATRIGKLFHYDVPLHIGTGGHDDPYSWDQTINPRGHDREIHDRIHTLRPGSFGGTLSWYADDADDASQTDGIAATDADRVLAEHAASGDPFFLAVGLFRPHTPYVSPRRYFEIYPRDRVPLADVPPGYRSTLPDPAVALLTWKKSQQNLPESTAREVVQAYQAAITFADAQVGRILESLKRHGLEDDTIVAFTSDHGYHMGDHGHWQKQTLFRDATRVPLIIAGPGVSGRGDGASPVEMIDLAPTLTSLAGVKTPKTMVGRDLSPALSDPSATVRDEALTILKTGASITDGRFRLTLWGDGEDGTEFYDRRDDPSEMHNLADAPEYDRRRREWTERLRRRVDQSRALPPALIRIGL